MTSGPPPARPRMVLRHARAALGLAAEAAPGLLVAQVALTVAGGVLPVVTAVLGKQLFDRLAGGGAALPALLGLAAAIGATGLAAAVTPQAMRYITTETERRVGVRAQERLYRAVNGQPGLTRLEDPAFQDRLQMAEQASRSGPGQLVSSALGLVQALIGVAGFTAALVAVSPVVAATVLAAALPMLRVHLSLNRAQAAMLWRTGHAQRRHMFFARLLTTPGVGQEVRLFGLGDFFRERMRTELTAVNDEYRVIGRRQLRSHALLAVVSAAVAGGGLMWMIAETAAGRATVGDVSMFIAAMAGVQAGLAGGVQHAATAHQALLLFEHFQEVVSGGPDLPVPAHPAPAPQLRRGIELRDVWFRYSPEHPWILRGVSLFIPHGQTVALVGLNGAGKSTLVKLLCRFYDPTRGSIHWDGADLRELDPALLRERIGAIFQDFTAYDLSAAENVAVGDLSALDDRPRVEQAARRAGVDGILRGLPRGYDTLLSRIFHQGSPEEDPQIGVVLSGGQWQRVALARALLRARRDLVILDEPSAGLDAQAEHEVHAALRRHREGLTTLLISHRLSAVREADRIVVLGDGVTVEDGSHAELMALGQRYAELFDVQARGYTDAGVAS
nr:ABC transporter ATP-binding protein [Dactylosporangium thailandense]